MHKVILHESLDLGGPASVNRDHVGKRENGRYMIAIEYNFFGRFSHD
jgi:hypothetical protein